MVGGEGVRLPLGLDCDEPLLDGTALGALHRLVGPGAVTTAWRSTPPGAEHPWSLLVVLVLIILVEVVVIVVAVIIGLSRSAVRLVGLVVPQLAVGAVLREQLGMGAALDRPAP